MTMAKAKKGIEEINGQKNNGGKILEHAEAKRKSLVR